MDFQDQGQSGIFETVRRLKTAFGKYWYFSWPPAFAVMALVIAIAFKLPSYYTTSFTIYIQPQQIKTNLLNQQGRDQQSEQFDALIKELVSRPRLLSIIQRFNLYPDLVGLKGQEKALKRFRNAYTIENVASILGHNPNTSPTFRVTFSHQDPSKTLQVTEELQNLFIEESLVSQAGETRGTEEFFSSQLRMVQKKLEEIESKRQEYVRVNENRLPERREQAISEQRSLQSKLASNTQLVMANEARIRYLQQELAMTIRDPSTSSTVQNTIKDGGIDPGANLQQLKQALVAIQGRYSEKHPDVINLKERIRLLEQSSDGKKTPSVPAAGTFENTREARMLRREISELEVQSNALKIENEAITKQIEVLDKEIKSIPMKEQTLIQIERDYATQKSIYDKLMVDREQASFQASLIKSQKGSRFRIIEAPAKPQEPAGPPREIIAIAGVLAGILVFLVIPFSMFYFNSAFKFRKEVERTLDLPVLGVLPPLNTPGIISSNRRAMLTSLVTSFLTVAGGIALIIVLI
jgi:succinoglycan biosynthesis transport protein ExoP